MRKGGGKSDENKGRTAKGSPELVWGIRVCLDHSSRLPAHPTSSSPNFSDSGCCHNSLSTGAAISVEKNPVNF